MANRSQAHLVHPRQIAKKARTEWRGRLWTWFLIAVLLGIVAFSIYPQIVHHP